MAVSDPAGHQLVVLEDDREQLQMLREMMKERFPNVSFLQLTSESEFRETFEPTSLGPEAQAVRIHPRALFLLDVMVRWAKVSKKIPPMPDDVRAEGYQQAGVRCARIAKSAFPEASIVFHTVMDGDELPPDRLMGIKRVVKEPNQSSLIDELGKAFSA